MVLIDGCTVNKQCPSVVWNEPRARVTSAYFLLPSTRFDNLGNHFGLSAALWSVYERDSRYYASEYWGKHVEDLRTW